MNSDILELMGTTWGVNKRIKGFNVIECNTDSHRLEVTRDSNGVKVTLFGKPNKFMACYLFDSLGDFKSYVE